MGVAQCHRVDVSVDVKTTQPERSLAAALVADITDNRRHRTDGDGIFEITFSSPSLDTTASARERASIDFGRADTLIVAPTAAEGAWIARSDAR